MAGKKKIPLSPILKQNKLLFDLMKNTSPDYLFMMDPIADVFLASPAFVRIYDLPAETLMHISDLLSPLVEAQDRQKSGSVRSTFVCVMPRVNMRGCV